jgi:hypothetical protein
MDEIIKRLSLAIDKSRIFTDPDLLDELSWDALSE